VVRTPTIAQLQRVGDRDDLDDPGLLQPGHPLADGRLGQPDSAGDGRVGAPAVLLQLLDDRLADLVEQPGGGRDRLRSAGHGTRVSTHRRERY
jgi:hypothetical protein